jgi:hypothetical protein
MVKAIAAIVNSGLWNTICHPERGAFCFAESKDLQFVTTKGTKVLQRCRIPLLRVFPRALRGQAQLPNYQVTKLSNPHVL